MQSAAKEERDSGQPLDGIDNERAGVCRGNENTIVRSIATDESSVAIGSLSNIWNNASSSFHASTFSVTPV